MLNYINSFDDDEVELTVDRAGLYPCKLVNYTVDVKSQDRPKDMGFVRNNLLKVDNLCTTISAEKSGIRHELANKEHGLQSSVSKVSLPIYKNISELAQFLEKSGKKIKYRDVIYKTNEHLTDKKSTKNDYKRQLGESVIYKHNVIGKFLDVVTMEKQTLKTKNQYQENIKGELSGLCKSLHDNGMVVSTKENDLEGDEKVAYCVDYIMNSKGLISKSDDSVELKDKDCQKPSKGVDKNLYYDIFCSLNMAKAKKLNEARVYLKDKVLGSKRYTKAEIERLKARVEEAEGQLRALELDDNELMEILPGYNLEQVNAEKIAASVAEREVDRASQEEALRSMDDQNRIVPYCPIY